MINVRNEELEKEGFKLRGTFYYDPIEDTEEFKAVIESINKEAEAELRKQGLCPGAFGTFNLMNSIKKDLLKTKSNIEWKTPAEINIHIDFD